MSLDDDLLRRARDAGARLVDLERELDIARADYHHAVRRLHLAGASMREIATVLDLSHQRVHQIIESAGGNRRRWKRSSACDPNCLFCSFCRVAKKHAGKLVAGPGVYICHECISIAARVVAEGVASGNERTTLEPIGEWSGRRCSFCRKGATKVGVMAGGVDAAICTRCLELCKDIVAETTSSRSNG